MTTLILPSILMLCSISCDKGSTDDIPRDTNGIQQDVDGKLIPKTGGGVGIAVASAGVGVRCGSDDSFCGGLNVNIHASESQTSPFADVWLDGSSRLIKFHVDSKEVLKEPLVGDFEVTNSLIPSDQRVQPNFLSNGYSPRNSVYWGRWIGDHSFRPVVGEENNQEYGAITFPLMYAFTDRATAATVIQELSYQGTLRNYQTVLYETANYIYQNETDPNQFEILIASLSNFDQPIKKVNMEVQFGSDAQSGIKSFEMELNFGTVVGETVRRVPLAAQGNDYRINKDPIPLEMETCQSCVFDVPFGMSGHLDYVLVGERAEVVIASFVISNSIQAFYGTFVLGSEKAVGNN